ncbi:MAG: DUF4065 domain-containing protein [Haliscomenobacteraceae bacterium CHB4]|nr:hypothetical protein [Saprospiraceae bacterium]MCE7921585.1 DUF4065 domain-containing protein [Haliscomenobacteraceae bacterium CHB4]
MSPLNNVLLYLYREFPNPLSLGASRAIKMIFLADWRCAVDSGEPMTDIEWRNSDRGPYSPLIAEALARDEENFFLEPNEEESLRALSFVVIPKSNSLAHADLDLNCKKALDGVVEDTHQMALWQLSNFVETQFPMRVTEQGDVIRLSFWAKQYRKIMHSPKEVEDFIRYHKLREASFESASTADSAFHKSAALQGNYTTYHKHLFVKRLK